MSAQANKLAELLTGYITVPEAVKLAREAGIELSSQDIYNAINYHRALEILKLPASRMLSREAFEEWLRNRNQKKQEDTCKG